MIKRVKIKEFEDVVMSGMKYANINNHTLILKNNMVSVGSMDFYNKQLCGKVIELDNRGFHNGVPYYEWCYDLISTHETERIERGTLKTAMEELKQMNDPDKKLTGSRWYTRQYVYYKDGKFYQENGIEFDDVKIQMEEYSGLSENYHIYD